MAVTISPSYSTNSMRVTNARFIGWLWLSPRWNLGAANDEGKLDNENKFVNSIVAIKEKKCKKKKDKVNQMMGSY